ncbi:MAG: hypothetical protein NPIRA02_38700 [Nitrospirales bacterium]|nr:MAG: hypothetical protein NPIRA02_38700 [Nitrospirales bacterium]
MRQLILHIGPPKTGTTSLQRFLNSASKELLSRGVLYPQEGRLKAGSVYRVHRPEGRVTTTGPADSHQLLAWTLKNEVEGVDAEGCWLDVLNEIHRVDPQTVIISGEAFFSLLEEQVIQVRKYLADFNVRVIIYLRDPFNLCLSAYTQHVKMGRYHHSFLTFMNEKGPHIFEGYETRTQRWKMIFGSEQIVYKSYDKLAKSPGLAQDFIRMLGFHSEDFEKCFSQNKRLNISPSNTGIQVIRSLNFLENCLGLSEGLKGLFRYVRGKLSAQNVVTNALFTVGGLIWRKPLFSKQEEMILRKKALDEFPLPLRRFLESVAHLPHEIPDDTKSLVDKI